MWVVIVDEVDQLANKDNDVLYKLFEWPSLPRSSVVLVGIANALDLTDRILPMLKCRGCAPQLLNFPPYTPIQLRNILIHRVSTVPGAAGVLDSTAISLCAAKVAAAGGDLRSALGILRFGDTLPQYYGIEA